MSLIESERAVLRRKKKSDLNFIVQLESDPDIMKFTSSGVTMHPAKSKERLYRRIEESNRHEPLGYWVAENKENGDLIGSFMLLNERHDYPELGYMVAKKYWGQGFATEISRAILEFGFLALRLDEIIATTSVDNHSSIRVLEKSGFQFVKQYPSFEKSLQKEVWSNYYRVKSDCGIHRSLSE